MEKRECEKCRKIVYYINGVGKGRRYLMWQKGSIQTGMSKKYPKEFAGYCNKHKPS